MSFRRGASSQFTSMSAFAGYKPGVGRSGTRMKAWKDTLASCAPISTGATGAIDVWPHTQCGPIELWRHTLPQIRIWEDKKTKVKTVNVWTTDFCCHEKKSLLEQQHFHKREDEYERKMPPKRCGLCKLTEWLWVQANHFDDRLAERVEVDNLLKAGSLQPKAHATRLAEIAANPLKGLDFVMPFLRYEGDLDRKGESQTRVLHVGGLCGLFKDDKLDDAQKYRMSEAKLSAMFEWGQGLFAKRNYAICVVNNAAPEDGVQITTESSLVGEQIQIVLNDKLKNGRRYEESPYCFQLEYFKKEPIFSKKYKATGIETIPLLPRIERLIRGPFPEADLEQLMEPFNQASMKANLESHCLVKGVPWSDFFPTKEQEAEWAAEDVAEDAAMNRVMTMPSASVSDVGENDGGDNDDDEDAAVFDKDGVELFACDNPKCEQPVRADATECPHCHVKMTVEGAEPAPAAPPPVEPRRPTRRRGAAPAEQDISFGEGKKA